MLVSLMCSAFPSSFANVLEAPLFNATGKVAFFIGGQINCSTTIHSSTDVMRILSTSSDVSEDKTVRQALPRTQSGNIRKTGFLSAFRSREQTNNMIPREAGMEQDLLNKIEGRDSKAQMNAFYTAYSKVGTSPAIPVRLWDLANMLTVHRGQIRDLPHRILLPRRQRDAQP